MLIDTRCDRTRRLDVRGPDLVGAIDLELAQQVRIRRRRRRFGPEHAGRAFEQLALPVVDLVKVHVVQLGQFGQRLLPSNGVQGHLGLEDRRVISPRSLAHGSFCFPRRRARSVSQSVHLSPCPDFRSHLYRLRSRAFWRQIFESLAHARDLRCRRKAPTSLWRSRRSRKALHPTALDRA